MALGIVGIDQTPRINELEGKMTTIESTANTAATNAATALSTAQQALAAASSGGGRCIPYSEIWI